MMCTLLLPHPPALPKVPCRKRDCTDGRTRPYNSVPSKQQRYNSRSPAHARVCMPRLGVLCGKDTAGHCIAPHIQYEEPPGHNGNPSQTATCCRPGVSDLNWSCMVFVHHVPQTVDHIPCMVMPQGYFWGGVSQPSAPCPFCFDQVPCCAALCCTPLHAHCCHTCCAARCCAD
jgi:hypothetical protein